MRFSTGIFSQVVGSLSFQMSNFFFRGIQGKTMPNYTTRILVSYRTQNSWSFNSYSNLVRTSASYRRHSIKASNQSYRNSSFLSYRDLNRICRYIVIFIIRQKAVSLSLFCGIVQIHYSFEITFSMCNS